MLRLYSAGVGSSEVSLRQRVFDTAAWAEARQHAVELLRARGFAKSADLLHATPFDVYAGTNVFNDEFFVLYIAAPPDQYIDFERKSQDQHFRGMIQRIVAATQTITGWYVRFVVVEIVRAAAVPPVAPPAPKVTSASVVRALADAENLIFTSGASSAVDRAHTAFHGYLLALAADAGLLAIEDEPVTSLFKKLRVSHPTLRELAADKDMQRVFLAAATIVDTVNSVRNRKTLAHPNQALLDDAGAMLVINAIRSLLHYLDAVAAA